MELEGENKSDGELWVVIRNTPLFQSRLVQTILQSRFPSHRFKFKAFQPASLQALVKDFRKIEPVGVLIDLKKFSDKQLQIFDSLIKTIKRFHKILVLSPESYRTLQARRKKALDQCTLVLSEMKSLDYILQLPRLMEEARLRKSLRERNEALQEMIQSPPPQSFHENMTVEGETLPQDLDQLCQQTQSYGLKISIRRWTELKARIGANGAAELVEATNRVLGQAVRGSDRVLHSEEAQFVIFLSDINSQQLKKCQTRVKEALNTISLKANSRSASIPFQIKTVTKEPASTN